MPLRISRLATVVALSTAVPLLAGYVSYAKDASPVSTVRTSGHALPGRYIVVLKDRTLSARSVRDESARLVKAHGGAVRQTYGTVLKGYAAAMSADQARRVAADPGVAYVEEDAEVRASAVQSNPPSWGLDRVDQESLPLDKSYSYATTASGVTAYVVDTGIRTSHSQFQGRASVGADEVGDGQNGQDCAGHGTHVAGTVGGKDYGVAKGVKLVSVHALNCSGKGSSSSIIAAADWITAHADKPAVVNMSINGSKNSSEDSAIKKSIASGVTWVVSSGNDGADACNNSPGDIARAVVLPAVRHGRHRPHPLLLRHLLRRHRRCPHGTRRPRPVARTAHHRDGVGADRAGAGLFRLVRRVRCRLVAVERRPRHRCGRLRRTARRRAHRGRPGPPPSRGGHRMTRRRPLLLVTVATVVLTVLATLAIRHAARPTAAAHAGSSVSVAPGPRIIARSTAPGSRDHLISVGAHRPGARRLTSPVTCTRVHASGGTALCLRLDGDLKTYELAVMDRDLKVRRTLPLVGVPNRARVSPSGRMVAWTVFVAGDSYNGGRFSTRAGILDTRTQWLVPTLEDWHVTLHGKPYTAVDLNIWGVTFAPDDRHFYATLSTKGHRYLVRGDLAHRTLRALRANVECPSLSPDGTRIAFKSARDDQPSHGWRLSVLDVATNRVTPLAETRSVDDQAAWLDGRTVAYALPSGRARADVWRVPADGSGTPRMLLHDADSPAALGGAS
ncbi:S8 family serine peptidase [Streptomyces caniferus]|uniref:S8 family serine peptidase n=1 Tax=Streptomyces caniferus TaxID=285557 RepID=UPI002E2BC0C3|nr:S8 family serine peptidase [Streptomyces caniferus]